MGGIEYLPGKLEKGSNTARIRDLGMDIVESFVCFLLGVD
jgi:hypothetical protein